MHYDAGVLAADVTPLDHGAADSVGGAPSDGGGGGDDAPWVGGAADGGDSGHDSGGCDTNALD